MTRKTLSILVLTCVALGSARDAAAQLDPLLFIKRVTPNVLVAVETTNRMQRDHENVYRDANVYTRDLTALWEDELGIAVTSSATRYRRKYVGLTNTDPSTAPKAEKFRATRIDVVTDLDAEFTTFDERTRLAIARRALAEAVTANTTAARFGLVKMRQQNPSWPGPKNEGPVSVTTAPQDGSNAADSESGSGKWKITRPAVTGENGAVACAANVSCGRLTAPDAANANQTIVQTLNKGVFEANALIPAGSDSEGRTDAPIDHLLADLKAEAVRLANADTLCRNTVAVLVVGGTRGQTSSGDPASMANDFLNIGVNHRVPVHVIAIAPVGDTTQLQQIAANSGGVYTEITAAMVNATPAGQPVPEFVRAVNFAVQHAYVEQSDLDTDPTLPTLPIGPYSEHQVTSPIIGTVNLEGAKDILGNLLPRTRIPDPPVEPVIPQRSNVMLTTGFRLPGFEGKLRAFRVYRPEVDASRPSGYKFVADGTRLWEASVPAAASRNIYTSLPNGTMVAFTSANAATLAPYLRTTDAAALIEYIRSQPLGAIVSSTPAMMDAPSLDPPPDSSYPAFANANKGRRTIVWVGANDGMLHALDGRLGVELWAYIPFNLLPKLKTLLHGQPVGSFRYFVDTSAKVADVKVAGVWRTYLIIGQGPGGTFYQTFDVTLDNLAASAPAGSDSLSGALTYFSSPTSVPLKWSFPRYTDFDVTLAPWGDIAAGAPEVAKTVGQTWSDPAVGQIAGPSGKYTVLTGSGPLPYTTQESANRKVVAGNTFYLLNAENGDVFDSRSVGSDGLAETVDNCQAVNDCSQLKNALQADPVATGISDSRFVSKAYIGDLDGKLWRFDITEDAMQVPKLTGLVQLFAAGRSHPLFASMATVNVGGTKQYVFQGTGSDLLPHNGVNQQYKLFVVLDNGSTGTEAGKPILLTTVDGVGTDEKVTSFPAVAGDIVFFTTTSFKPDAPCTLPDANLYAFTFIGGPAYDTNNSGSVTTADTQKVTTITGARATAPFIVDQHVSFGAGGKLEMLGDPNDFNNGVGQVGVRILSWREVR